MAEWKKVLVSGSNIEVNQITATGNTDIQGTLSLPDISDVSASLAAAIAGTATAGDGIFVTGNIVSVDSASLAADMAGDFITATNGTLNLATSVGTSGTNQFTGSFKGSLDGSINVVDTNATASFQLVFREGTVGGFSALYADQDNAKLRYNPGTNTLENTTLIGNVTGNLTGTATSASHVAAAFDTVGVSNATITLTDMGGNNSSVTVNNVVNSDTASAVMVSSDNETDGNFYITTSPGANGQTVYAHQSFVFNPSTSRVSVNPNVSGQELHFEANSFTGSFKGDVDGNAATATSATSATQITVEERKSNLNEHHVLFSRNTGSNQGVYGETGFTYIPTSNTITVGSVIASFQGDLDGTAATASAVDVTANPTDNAEYRITMVDAAGTTGETLYVDSGITYNPSTDSLTVAGDLIVNGTTTNINTTNLDVEDAFILLNSGSAATGDSGIIFGGSTGTAQQGSLMFWDASYKSDEGRLAVKNEVTSIVTGNQVPDYYVAGVVLGNEVVAAAADAEHSGNIRIDGGEIYIYVE